VPNLAKSTPVHLRWVKCTIQQVVHATPLAMYLSDWTELHIQNMWEQSMLLSYQYKRQ